MELIVQEGHSSTLSPGASKFTLLKLEKNASLIFSGSTSVLVKQFEAEPGSKIVYQQDDEESDPVFTLNALDASNVGGIEFIGNGINGSGFLPDDRAAGGKKGRNARDAIPFVSSGNGASKGGSGANGGEGQDGAAAVDFVLYFPNLKAGAKIKVEAIGGTGGRGQAGGKGGEGGSRSGFRDGANGGPGGHGGAGGDGGDQGKVFAVVVVSNTIASDPVAAKEIIEEIEFNINAAPGAKGSGGGFGNGGPPGKGAHVGAGMKRDGTDGSNGPDGAQGEGPIPGTEVNWIALEVFSQSDYDKYIAQQISTVFD